MNDIDLRCDGFLTWLDARRRDREPVLAEINALTAATHTIMTATGASPKSLDIAVAAFGLASATYANWNSRLLLSVNQSTVQEVVYTSQGKFREKINTFRITDQPTAIYVLRNYLRLCMPTTIEAAVNISTTLVQRDIPPELQENLVVANVVPSRPTIIRNVNAPLPKFNPPAPQPSATRLGPYETQLSQKQMKRALDILGCSGTDLGPAGSPQRRALTKFLTDNGKPPADRLTVDSFDNLREIKKTGSCSG
jgi:hypothetical protein